MSTLEYKSATPFMPQGGECVTKLIVVLPEGTTIDDVLPYIGSGKGKRLSTEPAEVAEGLPLKEGHDTVVKFIEQYRALFAKETGLFEGTHAAD